MTLLKLPHLILLASSFRTMGASSIVQPDWAFESSTTTYTEIAIAVQEEALYRVVHDVSNGIHRQRSARNLQQVPEDVCAAYVQASNGALNCSCARYDKRDVKVNCNFVNQLCNAGNSSCFQQSLEILVDKDNLVYSTKSCTNLSSAQAMNTCITVVTGTPGLYNDSVTCDVTLNGKTCSSCSACAPNGSNLTISWECCNVLTDKKQTCGYVSPQGATAPQFDVIPTDQQGKCKSGASHALLMVGLLHSIVASIVTLVLL
jgi:hypothetical protein